MRKLLLLIMMSLLAACTVKAPMSTPTVQTQLSWAERQVALAQFTAWHAAGVLAIQTAKGTDSMQFDWQLQNQNQYSLRFIGPIGTGYGTLETTPEHSVYLAPKGKIYEDTDAQTLLTKVTGWQLPVNHLYYWARGLPAPDTAATLQFDESNSHVTKLQQDGFDVTFQNYSGVNTLDLPSKLVIQDADIKVKIVITRWQG